MSIIKHVTLQKIVAHDFRYDPRILKEKGRGKFTKEVLFLHDNALGSPGTCNAEETGLPGLPMS